MDGAASLEKATLNIIVLYHNFLDFIISDRGSTLTSSVGPRHTTIFALNNASLLLYTYKLTVKPSGRIVQ